MCDDLPNSSPIITIPITPIIIIIWKSKKNVSNNPILSELKPYIEKSYTF